MKTVAVTAPNGWAIKEYLLGDFLPALAERARVVILSPLADDPAFVDAMTSARVSVERVDLPPPRGLAREVDEFFKVAHFHRLGSRMGLSDVAFRNSPGRRAGLPAGQRLKLAALRPVVNLTARSLGRRLSLEQQQFVERIVHRGLEREAGRLTTVLRRRRVDLLFSTMSLVAYFDRPPLWAAQRLGIPTAGIVPGWDNLHTKGRLPVRLSHCLVWSEWMARITKGQYAWLRDEGLTIVGPLFLDLYARTDLREDRASFIHSLGGDPARPLIVWACAPYSQTPHQPEMLRALIQTMRAGALPRDPQLLVRPHPVGGGSHLAEFRRAFPEVLFTETNADDAGAGTRWRPSTADLRILLNSLLHADVVINFSSTMTLDAFALDRPVVNVAFDHRPGSDFERNTRQAYESESYEPVVELGATKVAWTQAELVGHLSSYLLDPTQQRAERRALLRLICSEVDGRAAHRAAACVARLAGADEKTTDEARSLMVGSPA